MASKNLPSTFRRIMCKTLGSNFRQVTEIVETALPKPGPKEILVKNKYVGINASDINFTSGRYFTDAAPPFPCGFEGLGEIVQAGSETSLKVGQNVILLSGGAFSEFVVAKASDAVPVPSADPAFLSIILSGLTASVSLEKLGDLKPGKNVLVTAAAGGTGQFAVQIAKAAGCHVIGTCSNASKVEFLKSIGCDRPINYKVENLGEVLSKEYPKGLDVVYECIGNEVFAAALKNLAVFGRLIVIGMISNYQKEGKLQDETKTNVPMSILSKSAQVLGFFLPHYKPDHARHCGMLMQMYGKGSLKVTIDNGSDKPFVGLESVADAIDYMYTGKNKGKIVVALGAQEKSSL